MKTGKKTELRRKAEEKVKMLVEKNLARHLLDVEGKELLHELQVHMVELTLQNEELTDAYRSVEDARDRYQALYDSAPACYVTIDHTGLILEANLTAAYVLNVGRDGLIGHHLQNFLARKSADSLHLFLKESHPPGKTEVLQLRLQPKGNSPEIPVNVHTKLDHTIKHRRYLLVFVDPIWFRPGGEKK